MFKPVSNKYNFVEMEKKWLKKWKDNGVYKKYLNKNNKSDKYFSFQDGPITANNPMGVHHAWGRTYKDLWQKFYNLLGYKQRFQNGFDCQGLWIEVEVEKELGLKNKQEIENLIPGDKEASIAKFVELCKKRVKKYSEIQTKQSQRLGYFMDWDNSYFTMSDYNNYTIWYFLKKCFDNGWIYKGHESVPWCPRCETAISQHEMLTEDYKEATHESIILEFPILNKKNEYFLVWTTTPWTIPANIAIAIDSELSYSLVEGKTGDFFWCAQDTVKRIFKTDYKKIIKVVKGKKLVGLKYKGPFDELPAVKEVANKNKDKFHIVFATDTKILPINTEEGTGLVHTAVSAGTEDFKMGKKLGLPMIPVIDDSANYLKNLSFLSGKNAKKDPRIILDYLLKEDKKGKNWVFEIFDYKHRYPSCWRCKEELVWKIADEWYISMDKKSTPIKSESKVYPAERGQNLKVNLTLRQRMVSVAKKIKWIPGFGLDRELDWLKNMEDWLISKKNRYWGLALPIYECNKCDRFEVIGSKEELKSRAIMGWSDFEGHSPHKPYIDKVKIKCKNCESIIERIKDVGNPWLDAGIVPFSTISKDNKSKPLYLENKNAWRKWYPADFITESFPGQFKNWFYSLIAMSTVLENTNPFKTVLGFGTLLGEDGRPMHKSWGNAIEFNEAAEKIGVDVIRWMYFRQNPSDNLLFGYKKSDEIRRKFYIILWNVYKFFIDYANLENFIPKEIKNFSPSNILDKWILSRFSETIFGVEKKLRDFDSKNASVFIEDFVNDLSLWYIRRSRDRVWVNSEIERDKLDFYFICHFIIKNLAVILSPVLPFLSEEIYTNLCKDTSVHLAVWPEINKKYFDRSLNKDMTYIREMVEKVHSQRKSLSIPLRQPLNKLTITTNYKFNRDYKSSLIILLKKELNVKEIVMKTGKKESVILDTKLSEDLKNEGEARKIIRQIQSERKKLKTKLNQFIDVEIKDYPEEYEKEIKRRCLIRNLKKGGNIKVTPL